MPSVLFVCTANRFRSPLAAAMFSRALEERGITADWKVGSAGVWAMPGQPALAAVILAAARAGLDLTSHRSSRVSARLLSNYDLVVAMETDQKEALLAEFPQLEERVFMLSELTERRSYDIPDALGSEPEMLAVLEELDSLIRRGAESIRVMGAYLENTLHPET
jgi:protein-tyrosine-phosphatase